jgi:hypothetical protein
MTGRLSAFLRAGIKLGVESREFELVKIPNDGLKHRHSPVSRHTKKGKNDALTNQSVQTRSK